MVTADHPLDGDELFGAVAAALSDLHERYYQRPVSAQAILSGQVSPPRGAWELARSLGQQTHKAKAARRG